MRVIKSKRSGGLVVSEDVIVKIASVAAKDVDGVYDLSNHVFGIKGIFTLKRYAKPVRIVAVNGVIALDVYIVIEEDKKIPDVCSAVQSNVKSAVQNMTGKLVSKVNVVVDDIHFNDQDDSEEE